MPTHKLPDPPPVDPLDAAIKELRQLAERTTALCPRSPEGMTIVTESTAAILLGINMSIQTLVEQQRERGHPRRPVSSASDHEQGAIQ